jgi:hypothetical protein
MNHMNLSYYGADKAALDKLLGTALKLAEDVGRKPRFNLNVEIADEDHPVFNPVRVLGLAPDPLDEAMDNLVDRRCDTPVETAPEAEETAPEAEEIAPEAEEIAPEVEEIAPEAEEVELTVDVLRGLLNEASTKHAEGIVGIRAVAAKHGGPKLQDIPQENWPALAAELRGIISGQGGW